MLVTGKERRSNPKRGRRSKPKTRTPAEALADISLTDDRLVPTAEAGRLLGQTPKTMREWRLKRIGPVGFKMGAGKQARVFYRLSSLEAWVRANVTSVIGGA